MLFTPKKYGKSYRLFLALSFFGGALVSTLFALVAVAGWMAFADPSDRPFVILTLGLVAIAFGALGFGQWQWFKQTPAD